MISPLIFFANKTDSWDLPDAVGPEIKIIFLLLFDFNPKISSLVSIIDNS